jgi:hypothetical protein
LEWEEELEYNLQLLAHSNRLGKNNRIRSIVINGTLVHKNRKNQVLLCGNDDYNMSQRHTEVLDFSTSTARKYADAGPHMLVSRMNCATVTLQDGNVAVFGGFCNARRTAAWLAVCELYDAARDKFRPLGRLWKGRCSLAAVMLQNGIVFITGGNNRGDELDSCEFYNPYRHEFLRSEAVMDVARRLHTASLLPNGKVLVCGGRNGTNRFQTTLIYDPVTDSFTMGPDMDTARSEHTAVTLQDGRVLVCGGEVGNEALRTTEFYDYRTNSFSSGPDMFRPRSSPCSVLLPDGKALICGGSRYVFGERASIRTEIYDPWTNSFSTGVDMTEPKRGASAALF